MTPTTMGRWQTRIVMMATLGAIVTAIFALLDPDTNKTYWRVLGYVLAFGLGWDLIYMGLQQFRWDRDWPAVFQWLTGIWEGVFLYIIIDRLGLPGVKQGSVPLGKFIAQYGLVWLSIYIWVQGPMRTVFPRWRFRGGRLI